MGKLFVLLNVGLSFFFVSPANSQVLNGDILLTTQAQVDAFNFTQVNGTITVSGASITNVNGLSELTQCKNLSLSGNAGLTSLIGLANLQQVENNVTIRNNSVLTNLDGFSSLTTVGTVHTDALIIENNDQLLDIDGLFSLVSATRLTIKGNAKLANLDGLSALTTIEHFFTIADNPLLSSLQGLANFTSVSSLNGNFTIDNNDALTSLNGLSKVENLAGLIIKNNAALTDLNGLSSFKGVVFGGLIIENNTALTNIDALHRIQGMSSDLLITGNPSLSNLNGLSNLAFIGNIDGRHNVEIKDNASLASLSGLSSLEAIRDGNLVIQNNDALIDINLSKLALVGQVVIILGNLQLPNLDGLSSLKAIAGLNIQQNSALTNLDGLSALNVIVRDLGIQLNPALTNFCGLSNLFTKGEIGGSVVIKNNGANTVSIAPPPDIMLNNDPGICSKDVTAVVPTVATVTGCLDPQPPSRSPYPAGNIFPVGISEITWSVTDGAGNTATTIQKVIITDNEAPVITQFPADVTVACRGDVPAAATSAVTATDNCSVVVTHEGDVISNQTCVNRYTLTRTYKATDRSGNATTRQQIITVNDNLPPQIIDLGTSRQVLAPPNHKMQDILVNYRVLDNCISSPNYTFDVTSNEPANGTGDGDTDLDWEIIDDHNIRLRAERAASGSGRAYTLKVTANDGCNLPVTATVQVMVVHNIAAPRSGSVFKVGSTVSLSGEFWDVPENKHTAKWLIDGSTTVKATVTEPSGSKNGKVTGSYKFTSPGVYKLQMNVTDQNGITTYANTNGDLEAILVVYDPNGGHAYGGGYFNSPAGALLSNPNTTGKASYGFAMNYFKNSTYPKGETQFEFKVGEFEFNALNFDYLVINQAMAQFRGTGKITGGQSGIGFTMTVVDGQVDGSGVDKIRMKIYHKNTGAIIYDSEPGASDAAPPSRPVGANSTIVISGMNAGMTSVEKATFDPMTARPMLLQAERNAAAFPNPTNHHFWINTSGFVKAGRLTMQVSDIYGRVIEKRVVTADSLIRLGDSYKPGIYVVQLLQGKLHKEIKLVKLSD